MDGDIIPNKNGANLMRRLRRMKYSTLSVALLLNLVLIPVISLGAEPTGALYWKTTGYPNEFFLYNTTDTYNGAVAAFDYACRQNAGTGTYSGAVEVLGASINFPAEKAAYCLNTMPFYPGTFEGALYYTYLYCNGAKRERFDDNTCEQPVAEVNRDKNYGPPPCENPGS
jgi:hypothetical protein